MWFLPMLFWCFIVSYFLLNLKMKEELKLLVLFLLAIFSFIPLPFQLTPMLYYLFYFYLGIYLYRNKILFSQRLIIPRNIVLCSAFFLISFFYLTLFMEKMEVYSPDDLLDKIGVLLVLKSSKLIYSLTGVLSFYFFVIYLLRKQRTIPQWLLKINSCCFGVYIFHQFMLEIIYYKTSLSLQIGTYWLPWISCFMTIVFSFGIVCLLKKTPLFGKLL